MTEPLGAGNSREYDILGIKMFDSAELRVHMTGKAILRTGAKTQGQGHETTWAQIVSHELGIPADDVIVEEGDTDTAPFGMGTYASRSTPVAGAAVAMVARKVRAKARKLAAHLLEVSEEDVEWELGRFYVRGAPERGATIQECAAAAYSNMPDGMEPGLENNAYYDPPNLTWPFAVYIVTVEVDPETGVWDVLRVVAVDDCGVRINPMIVEGQIMGGLTEAYAMANMQFQTYDADGNQVGSNYMDYLLPDRVGDARLRAARGRHALPAPPHRGQGRRRVRGGRRARGVRQRGARRAGVDGRAQHRHAGAARPRLAGAAGRPGRVRRTPRAERLMILDNEFTVDAPVDRVWAYFLDVPNLAPCLPGATLVGDDGDGTYQGKVVAALGPVKLNFSGTAKIVEADEAAHRMVLQGGGLGGPRPRRGRDDDHGDDGAHERRHAGERRAGPVDLRRGGELRARAHRRRHERAARELRRVRAGEHHRRRRHGDGRARRPGQRLRHRPAGHRDGAEARVRPVLPPLRQEPLMVLWWIGNAILLFVVLPVVIALLNRVLAAVERIRAACDDILARRRRAARRGGPGARAPRHDRRDRAPDRRRRHPLRGLRRPAPAAEGGVRCPPSPGSR